MDLMTVFFMISATGSSIIKMLFISTTIVIDSPSCVIVRAQWTALLSALIGGLLSPRK